MNSKVKETRFICYNCNYLEISNSPTSVFSDKQFAEINFISTPQSTISVDFLGNPTVTPKTDPVTGSPYYNIKGDFTRSENADVYLILKRQPKSGGQAGYGPLCHYPVDFGNTFGFYYGDGDAQPPLLPPTRCPGHPAELEAFSHLYNYSAYFAASMVTKQTPISDIISFPDISPPPLANPIDGLIVNPKKSGNKHYYEVSGTVNDTKPGNHKIVFHLLRLPDQIGGPKQEAGILGTIDYKAGNFDLLKNGIGSFAGVAPGSYLLEIRDNNGALLQEKILSDITESPSSGNSNYVPFEYTDEQQNIINNGLVTTECGYDLGPKGSGRMCGFADFVELIQRVIEYIFILVLPIAAIVFAYAGFLYMTSGGSPDKRSAAKKAMTSLVIGIVVVMAAWLIVKTILTALGASAGFTMFLNI
ncbi:MAG: pilin [Minisyncoccia bacterium]